MLRSLRALGPPGPVGARAVDLDAIANVLVAIGLATAAVLRGAVPEARPGRDVGLALGVTCPVDVVVGPPLHHAAVLRRW